MAVKSYSVYKEEKTWIVPRNKLEFNTRIKLIGEKYKFKSILYGHAGDGNLHINILRKNISDIEWDLIIKAIREIFKLCVELGGTISGEHGIGLVQKGAMDIPFSEELKSKSL